MNGMVCVIAVVVLFPRTPLSSSAIVGPFISNATVLTQSHTIVPYNIQRATMSSGKMGKEKKTPTKNKEKK